MKSQNFKYIPAIDHLRGFAAMLVVFYHGVSVIFYQLRYGTPFTGITEEIWPKSESFLSALVFEGHTGVALFMVLSGFIFTIGTYGSDLNYWKFLRNRFLRTYPLFLFILIVGTYSYPADFNFVSMLQSIFFMANQPGAITSGPFTVVSWAIAVEWQFYLVFPFLLLFINHQGLRIILLLILLLIVMRSFAYLQDVNVRDLSYLTIVGRMDQFLIGMGLGIYYRKRFRQDVMHDVLFIFGTVLVIYLLYVFNLRGGWPIVDYSKVIWPTLEGCMWAVFIIGYLSISRWLPTFVSNAFASLGLISYSLYLIHFIIVSAVFTEGWLVVLSPDSHLLTGYATTIFVIVPLSILVSMLTYYCIELPFLNLRSVYKITDTNKNDVNVELEQDKD